MSLNINWTIHKSHHFGFQNWRTSLIVEIWGYGSTSRFQLELRLLQLRTTKSLNFLSYMVGLIGILDHVFFPINPHTKMGSIFHPLYILNNTSLFKRSQCDTPEKITARPTCEPCSQHLPPLHPPVVRMFGGLGILPSKRKLKLQGKNWGKMADLLPGSSEQVNLLWDVGDGWFWRFWGVYLENKWI